MLRQLLLTSTKRTSTASRLLFRRYSTNGGNQGMNAEVFRSVFQPLEPKHPAASSLRDGKYLRRWDWHLRNFIYALIPPACAYAYILAIEWYMADRVAEYREKITEQKSNKSVENVKVKTKTLEERVAAMEQRLMNYQREATIREAKSAVALLRQPSS